MIRQLEGMGKVMTEDFVENKQEAEVVNNEKTAVKGSDVAEVESENREGDEHKKSSNWYLYLALVPFFIMMIWRGITLENKYVFSVMTFCSEVFCLSFMFFTIEFLIIYRYSGNENPYVNYRKFLAYMCLMYILSILVCLLILYNKHGDIDEAVDELIFHDILSVPVLMFTSCLVIPSISVLILILQHYNIFQRWHIIPKKGVTKAKSRFVFVTMFFLYYLPFIIFLLLRTIWEIGLVVL